MPSSSSSSRQSAASQRLSFVHVNDQHSSFLTTPDANSGSSDGVVSPWARQRGAFERARAVNPFTLFTNAGDDHEKGSVAEHMADGPDGSLVPELVRAMEFDVRTIGNHDFCHSLHNAADLTHDPTALVVVSNICPRARAAPGDSSTRSLPLPWGAVKFGVKQVGALRVGFFALVSRPWDELQRQPDGLQYYDADLLCDFSFARVASDLVAAHRDEVDLLVHVSHLGLQGDVELCEAVDGIDIVLGGHSHTVLSDVRIVNGASIIHCGASGEYVGQLDLEVLPGGRGPTHRVLGYELKRTQDEPPHYPTEEKIASIVAARAAGWDSPLFPAPSDGTIDVVQRFAAEALLARPLASADGEEACCADIVLLDDALAKLRKSRNVAWETGEWISPQTLLEVYPIEIQPPSTDGTTSFYATEVSCAGLRRLLDMVLTHGSLRDGNSLAEYVDHLNATGEHGVIPHKKRAWRLALRSLSSGDGTCVVHGSRCDCYV